MAGDLALEYLTVSRSSDPPAEATLRAALNAAGIRLGEWSGAPVNAPASGRTRLGTYTLLPDVPEVTARLSLWRHDEPVLAGLGEQAFTALTRGLDQDDLRTLHEGTLALTLRCRCAEGAALAALDWMTRVLRALIDVTAGAALDLAAQRCLDRSTVKALPAGDPLAHIVLHDELWDADSRWLHTHGLQKFGRAELDVIAVPHSLRPEAETLLHEVAVNLAGGAKLLAGQEIALEDLGTAVALGVTADLDHQAPYGRLRLADAPLPGEREGNGIRRLLANMALAEAVRHLTNGDIQGALEIVDRVLAANPDDCAALALKGKIALRSGAPVDALDLGELMELRVPLDYRGPLTCGEALLALGRYREALLALDRAIQREPEAAEAFALRAEAYARLGETQRAALDRTRAAYLAR